MEPPSRHGAHHFRPTKSQPGIAVVWAKASERGFDPFAYPSPPAQRWKLTNKTVIGTHIE